ncbi:hypothetical protein J5N97_008352 [Dioscorea zingiberensis]|uniref:Uncharacterized protein n=1 Tax=Dioscorea zingiberensis TaxID=325984 RepID=A0A9D5CWS5_9LILI|nr:hypothetical protein J5N97_008352 [Dioscorea zingiberensis]
MIESIQKVHSMKTLWKSRTVSFSIRLLEYSDSHLKFTSEKSGFHLCRQSPHSHVHFHISSQTKTTK